MQRIEEKPGAFSAGESDRIGTEAALETSPQGTGEMR